MKAIMCFQSKNCLLNWCVYLTRKPSRSQGDKIEKFTQEIFLKALLLPLHLLFPNLEQPVSDEFSQ